MGCGCAKKYKLVNGRYVAVDAVDNETQPPNKAGQSTTARVVRSAPMPSFRPARPVA